MKKFVFLFLIFNCALRAQDTIRFANGNILAAKVMEVGETEIKYNRYDNLTGPLYVADRNEIKSLKYANGSMDVFKSAEPKAEKPIASEQKPSALSYKKIDIIDKRLYYNDRTINERTLLRLADNCPDVTKKNILAGEKARLYQYRNKRSMSAWLLYGGIGVAYFGIIAGSEGADGAGAMAFVLGTGASITGGVLTSMYKNKRKQKRVDIAHIYNGDKYEFR